MAFTETSLGDIGHLGIDRLFKVESEKYTDYSERIVGNVIKTKQSYFKMKSLAGFSVAEDFAEGAAAPIDDYQALFVKNWYPERIGKMIEFSDDVAWTDQYRIIVGLQPAIAKSFMLKQNMIAASLLNLGFTSTTMGMVAGETLYSTSHSNNGYALSNTPSTNLAFGPLAIEQMKSQMRNQVSARGDIMPNDGAISVQVPVALDGRAWAIANSSHIVGSNNNDSNYARWRVTYDTIPFLTSSTAWFARYTDNDDQGLFLIHFKPYSIEKLSKDERLFNRYVASQKLVAGWRDAHGTFGTAGA